MKAFGELQKEIYDLTLPLIEKYNEEVRKYKDQTGKNRLYARVEVHRGHTDYVTHQDL